MASGDGKMAAPSCVAQRSIVSTKCTFLLLVLLVCGCVGLQLLRWEDHLSVPGVKHVPPPYPSRVRAGIRTTTRSTVTAGGTLIGTTVQSELGLRTRGIATDVHAQELVNNTPNNSSSDAGSSPPIFHPKWNADCLQIVNGNEDEIRRVVKLLNLQRIVINHKPKKPLMPPDGDVLTWTGDCSTFRRARGYPSHPLSEEERAFPVAYILVVHKHSAQVERLLRAIYQPQNIYCVHIDRKSPGDFSGAVAGVVGCFENVFLASRTELVQYAGFTRLLADIRCMEDLAGPRALGYPWKYVINLSGQDFPLRSNLETVRTLRSYGGHNDIGVDEPPPYKRKWTSFRHVVEGGHVVRTRQRKEPPPGNLTVYAGLAYYAATRRLVEYVLNNQTAKDLLEWTRDTYSPDENYWATLQAAAGTPGGGGWQAPGGSGVRFIRWFGRRSLPVCRGHTVRSVCVFSMGYVQHLVSQKHLFANKFDYTFDPVALQCLEEHLENKTHHQVTNQSNESTVSRTIPKT